jgi:predicted thioesterase
MTSTALTFTVTDDDTAEALGSGDLPVLATPRLVAWCEAATLVAIGRRVGPHDTSVGTRVSVDHMAAAAVGEQVEVSATISHEDGRLVRFAVAAHRLGADGTRGKQLGAGEITRVVVDRDRFLGKLAPR